MFETSETEISIIAGRIQLTVRNHTRIKIYNEKGQREANIKLNYIEKSHAENIQKIEGQTYNLDVNGNIKVTKLDKKNIFKKPVNNRISEIAFGLPEVKSGSVIEYRYTLHRTLLYVNEWSFQRNIPVVHSSVSLIYPPEFKFTPVPRAYQEIESDFKRGSTYDIQSYSMKNVPPLREEPYMSSELDYIQRIRFSLLGYFSHDVTIKVAKEWPKVIEELLDDEDFGLQLKKNIPRTKELDVQLNLNTSDYQRMVTIYEFVRKNMVWDGKKSIWALDGVRSAWDKKTGNSGEINLILVNLLKEAGLKASPVLVSTRDNGRVLSTDPTIHQFNTVMAYVLIDSSFFVMDATDKNTPASLVPPSVVMSEGLLISKSDNTALSESDWGWKVLWNENKVYEKQVNLSGIMAADGRISGTALVINKGYAKTEILSKNDPDSVSIANAYKAMHANMSFNELKLKNEQVDSLPFEQRLGFNFPSDENGDYRVININLFTGLNTNPFLGENRNSDVFFGYNQKYMIRGGFTIPESFAIEELPKNVRMITPDQTLVLTRMMQKSNNIVSYLITLDFKQPLYSVDEYKEFSEYYKQLNSLLNEPIVVRKNMQP